MSSCETITKAGTGTCSWPKCGCENPPTTATTDKCADCPGDCKSGGDFQVPDDLEAYIMSPEFDKDCKRDVRRQMTRGEASAMRDFEFSDSFQRLPVAPTSSSISSMGASPYEVDPLEAQCYYHGVGFGRRSYGRAIIRAGPKLVYRTSKDIWVPPSDPYDHGQPREMRLCDVPRDHELAKNPALWDMIRDQAVEVLKRQDIKFSTVQLVCFTWLEKKEYRYEEEGEEEEEEEEKEDQDGDGETDEWQGNIDELYERMANVKAVEDENRHTTLPTIWIGVLEGTLASADAHELSIEILGIARQYGVTDVEVGFCESEAHLLSGPPLFATVDGDDHRKSVIDELSTVLPMSVAGIETPMQGTLTCFFHVGNELYAISARHNFFEDGKEDDEYTFVDSAPRKDVLVMGPDAFKDYLASIRAKVTNLNNTVEYLVRLEDHRTKKVDADPRDNWPAGNLEKTQAQLAGLRAQLVTVKQFYLKVVQNWSKVTDRIIGHVVWAPKIEVNVAPYGYTQDFCVIHLDKTKFRDGFLGNALSLGPDSYPGDFIALMRDRDDVRSEFECPWEGLAEVKGMLTAEDISAPSSLDLEDDRIRRVIQGGTTSNATVGILTRFKSHVRRYTSLGPRDSIELTILPHPDLDRPFSRGGDSGALVIDARFKAVALLTAGKGMGKYYLSDITFGTLFEWMWSIVTNKYPGANLYFDNLDDFFAD